MFIMDLLLRSYLLGVFGVGVNCFTRKELSQHALHALVQQIRSL